jgi:hypothetical protein
MYVGPAQLKMSDGVAAWIVLVSVGGVSGSFFTDQRPLIGSVIPACSYHFVIAVWTPREVKYAHYENDNAPIKTFDKPFVLPARFAARSTRPRLLFPFADRSSCYPATSRVPSKFQRKDRVSRAL